jgi:MoaA/NifB/PqqE/SkfB family radical SAM enzyme
MTNVKESIFKGMVNQAISNKVLRGMAVKQLKKYLYNSLMDMVSVQLKQERLDQYAFTSSIVDQASKNLDKGFIKPEVVKKMAKVFAGDSYSPDRYKKLNPVKEAYKEKYGDYPPQFLVLAPGKGCNLHCTGCYASAEPASAEALDFETTRRIVREAHDLFASRFMTITGGEPILYKSDGKTLLDIFEEFNDMFFLIYTNGTLINQELAEKLAKLGNVTPAISIEGWEEQTDQRRGKGVYRRIIKAMENLRNAGVPFGISLTATNQNAEMLLQDDYYDYFFNELGVTYMWQFQLMPIGRGKDAKELMVTPEQRVKLFKQWTHLLQDKHYPIGDFWNSSSLSNGCIAYGRWSGYFYLDWNGNITPCAFVPYYVDNIKDLYSRDKTLADALQSKLFKNGRKWQKDYGFENSQHRDNILMPCAIRDHYVHFKQNILTPDAKGEDEDAEAILHDPEYEKMMDDFDQKLQNLTESIFHEKYLKDESFVN